MQVYVDDIYNNFVSIVAQGRDKTFESVDSIAQGRVWTGEQALANGLVDRLGDLNTAISLAADLADITEYSVQTVTSTKNWWDKLWDDQLGEMRIAMMQWLLGEDFTHIQLLHQVRDAQGIWARLPFDWSVR